MGDGIPTQDEPEGDVMLRIDQPRARSRDVELAADGSFSRSQRSHALRRRNPAAGLSLDGASFMPAAVPPARARGARSGAPLPGQDDRTEPGPGDAPDRALRPLRQDRSLALPAPLFSPALYAGRYRTAGPGR